MADYVRYRPGYPAAVLDALAAHAGLSAASSVADVGSGTGISAELLLRSGCTVFAVEPNRAMRAAAEERLADQPNFHSIDATAEATTLPGGCCDLVTVAQAFHWFDVEAARTEFLRILQPHGQVALFWNIRLSDTTPFLRAYEDLVVEYGIGYSEVNALASSEERLNHFFGAPFRRFEFDNEQSFDAEGLAGRLLSSSYAPPPGHPRHEPMLSKLRDVFHEHAEGGRVRFLYRTHLFLGRPRAGGSEGPPANE